MKCIKKRDTIKRVKDAVADKMCSTMGWAYCPKSDWKKQNKK